MALPCACDDTPPTPFETPNIAEQQAYFPLEIGKYVEYQADSIIYDFSTGGSTIRDSSSILVREEITDTVRDITGELVFVIERSERNNDTQPWVVRNIWSATRNGSQAIRSENNLRFLRLVFPFDNRTRWDGNVWIDEYQEIEIAGERIQPFVNWGYRVDAYDVSAQVGTFTFDSVLVITEVDETNAIERRFSRSWYAKDIGLVRREQEILDSQYCNQIPAPSDCLTKPWKEKAQKGFTLKQWLINHN